MKEQDKEEKKDKRFSKKLFLKIMFLSSALFFLMMFFEPQFHLNKTMDWEGVGSSLFMQTYSGIIGILIAEFLPIKKAWIKTAIAILFMMFVDNFIALNFVFEWSVKNIVMVIVAGISFAIYIVFLCVRNKIESRIDSISDLDKLYKAQTLYFWVKRVIVALWIIGMLLSTIMMYSNRPFRFTNFYF